MLSATVPACKSPNNVPRCLFCKSLSIMLMWKEFFVTSLTAEECICQPPKHARFCLRAAQITQVLGSVF